MSTNHIKKNKKMNKQKRMTKTKRNRKSKNRKNIKYISKKVMKGGSICDLFTGKSSSASASGNDSAPGSSKKGAFGNEKVLPDFNYNLPTGAGFDTSNIADYINFIKQHQANRFKELEFILDNNSTVKVIIPGIETKHNLGTGLAIGQWESWENKLGSKLKTKFSTTNIDNLTKFVNELDTKYKGRISFGIIGDKASSPPSKTVIHVWGANENNWNLKDQTDIVGGGQAAAFKKQKVGVFGIATIYHDTNLNNLFQSATDNLEKYFE